MVVGGHSRNIGKTSVVAGLIRKLPHRNWTAMKVTQYGHGVCSRDGGACGARHGCRSPFALSRGGGTQPQRQRPVPGRGRRRSYWLRASAAISPAPFPPSAKLLRESGNAIVESNSLLQFVDPDLYVMVLDFSREDLRRPPCAS